MQIGGLEDSVARGYLGNIWNRRAALLAFFAFELGQKLLGRKGRVGLTRLDSFDLRHEGLGREDGAHSELGGETATRAHGRRVWL